MNVVQWNVSKVNTPATGVRKYEDELFKNIINIIDRKKLNINIIRVLRSRNKIFGSTIFSWIYKYKSFNCDIVHATSQVLAPVLFFRKPKKLIVTVHDLAPLKYPFEIRDVSEKIQWCLLPRALKKVDSIIAISKFTRDELINLLEIEEEKIDVVYQGVNTDLYKSLNKEKCRRYFNLNLDKKYILYVASNLYHKRIDLARAVFNQIRKCRDDVMMIKAGYSEKLSGEGIISMGWIKEEDMPKLYNSADVYLHTSEYEGFGLPVLEAMACGLPIVASNRAAIPEVVGNAGYLVDLDENCVEEFAEKVLKSLDREKINKKGIRRARNFSWMRTAEETLSIYLGLGVR